MDKRSTENTPQDPDIPLRPGWEGMRVWWLTSGLSEPPTQLVINITEFPPGVMHEIHRHPDADEFVFVLSGSGLQLSPSGETRHSAGELVVVPKGSWHGLRNDTDEPLVVLAGYGGVATADAAGYETYSDYQSEVR
jgi:quercetin dioxygenase-like cupin family protein